MRMVDAVFPGRAKVVNGPGGDPFDGQERPVEQDVRLPRSSPEGLVKGRCECGRQVDGLGDVVVDGARPEPCCELGLLVLYRRCAGTGGA